MAMVKIDETELAFLRARANGGARVAQEIVTELEKLKTDKTVASKEPLILAFGLARGFLIGASIENTEIHAIEDEEADTTTVDLNKPDRDLRISKLRDQHPAGNA